MQDATRGSHAVILLTDGMREIAEEDLAPPIIGGSMFPPTLIGSTGNVPLQLVVVAKGELNYKSVAKFHHTNGNCYSQLVIITSFRLRVQLPPCVYLFINFEIDISLFNCVTIVVIYLYKTILFLGNFILVLGFICVWPGFNTLLLKSSPFSFLGLTVMLGKLLVFLASTSIFRKLTA